MSRLGCYFCVFGLLFLSVVGQECLVSLDLAPELTNLKVGGSISVPIPATLFQDAPNITLTGAVAISMTGVECPENLLQISEAMAAADRISFVTGVVPPLETDPDSISTSVIGLADLALTGLKVEVSNDDVNFDEERGLVVAEDTLFSLVDGETVVTSALISDITQPLVDLSAESSLLGQLAGTTLSFSDVSIVIPVEIVQEGIPVSGEVTLSGSVGGEIVLLEGTVMAPLAEP